MSELVRGVTDVVANAAGNTVSPVVTALLTTAAIVTRSPELAVVSLPTGALAGALTQQGVQLVSGALNSGAERVQDFADAVTDESGQAIEDFLAEHVTDAGKRDFLGRVVAAAANANSAWKIRTLAQAFVRGAKDGDLIDETLMLVEVVSPLDPAHARYLAAVVEALSGNSGTPPDRWQLVGRSIVENKVLEQDPGLIVAAPIIRRKVAELGLVREVTVNASRGLEITDLGMSCAEWLRILGAEVSADPASGG